jgi:hypothetical protein
VRANAAPRGTVAKPIYGKELGMPWYAILIIFVVLCGSLYLSGCSSGPNRAPLSTDLQLVQEKWLHRQPIETPREMQFGHRLELVARAGEEVYVFLAKPFKADNGQLTFVISRLNVAERPVREVEMNVSFLLDEPVSVPCGDTTCDLFVVTGLTADDHLIVSPVGETKIIAHHLR